MVLLARAANPLDTKHIVSKEGAPDPLLRIQTGVAVKL